jgi:hypothetical protein
MSPKPRLFVVEAEITMLRSETYYVFAHNKELAKEKLFDLLTERVEQRRGANIITDDVRVGDFNTQDIRLVDFEVGTAAPTEEITEEETT